MRVRDWQDVVSDLIEEDIEADGWRAIAGTRANGIGEDLYVGHPDAGLFQLKTYPKNPFEVKGVGTQIARNLDDEIGSFLPEKTAGRFAIQQPASDEEEAKVRSRRIEETFKAHATAPTTPENLFVDLMEAIDAPAFGPMEYEFDQRPSGLSGLSSTFDEAEEVLESELETLIDDDEINRGFG